MHKDKLQINKIHDYLYEIPKFFDSFSKPLKFLKVINFSPNETSYLSKAKIDECVKKTQNCIGSNGMYRHGDVIILSKNAKETTKKEAEQKIKEFKKNLQQELDIACNKQKITYKEYFLQIHPDIMTAYEAWQSCHRKLNIKEFLPFVAS